MTGGLHGLAMAPMASMAPRPRAWAPTSVAQGMWLRAAQAICHACQFPPRFID